MTWLIVGILIAIAFFLTYKRFRLWEKSQIVDTRREEIRKEDQVLDFPLGDVLSLYTGKTLSGVAGIHRLLNFLYGQELYDFQLSEKADEALPWITQQYPSFANLRFENTEQPAYWAEWLDDRITEFGMTINIRPIPIEQLKPQTNREAWAEAKKHEKLSKIENI